MQFIKLFVVFILFLQLSCATKSAPEKAAYAISAVNKDRPVIVGAERMDQYLPELSGQKIGLVVNQTSMVGNTHLVDTLLSRDIDIQYIFAPEHGFRGTADAGEKVADGKDTETGVNVISIYGKNRKPPKEILDQLDLVIFDIQDVGARFYTYISSMHYVMEACAENGTDFMVFDRPNPNGHYVDGPILDPAYQSFVGMHPIPIVHGMTIGEYAQMINGEGWLKDGIRCNLKVVTCENYNHQTFYELPVKPSPNLPDMRSIYLYPSTCFFEGTVASEGRGTPTPFQVYGHPDFPKGNYSFTPRSMPGAKYPKLEGETCNGFNLSNIPLDSLQTMSRVNLNYLIDFYQGFPEKANFFKTSFFDKLAGSDQLRKAIEAGKTEAATRATWEAGLARFIEVRKEYLLYRDFY